MYINIYIHNIFVFIFLILCSSRVALLSPGLAAVPCKKEDKDVARLGLDITNSMTQQNSLTMTHLHSCPVFLRVSRQLA